MCRPKQKGCSGFRTLREFNEVMLAKEGWSLINNPNSLAPKILKAKYYIYNNFLQDMLDNKYSYLWSSGHQSSEIIKKDLCWIIENRNKIIWNDNWILNQCEFKVLTNKPLVTRVSVVMSLIDEKIIVGTISSFKICFYI